MQRAATTLGVVFVLAVVAYVTLNLVAGISDNAAPSATSGFSYGKSFTAPLARELAPWLAIVIALLGPIVVLRNALDRPGRRRR